MKPRCRSRLAVAALLGLVSCAIPSGRRDAEALPGSVAAPVPTRTFLDVHRLGAGKVKLDGVADAHRHDLAVEPDYGVDYERYWVDEGSGTIYCLVHAPSATAASTVHREAHGLVADEVHEVRCSQRRYAPSTGGALFVATLDVGPAGVAAATAALDRCMAPSTAPSPRCLEWWFAADSGDLFALIEAADAAAAAALYRDAAGLSARSLVPVAGGK